MGRSGDLEMAASLYSEAASLEPTFAEAIESQGEALDVTGLRALATKQYELARKVRGDTRPGAPDRHFVLRQRGHFVAEIMAYDAVVRSLSRKALPYLARGNAYLAAGQPENALKDYDRALRLKPNSPEITTLKGEALSMLGRYQQASEAFDTALAAHPNDAEALNGRAIARIALGQIDEANGDWRRQLDLLGDRAAARACVALRLADHEAALAHLEGALVKEPADPYWHLYRLTAQVRLGIAFGASSLSQLDDWPGPLLALHRGQKSEEEVLARADTDCRRAEAHFQLGVMALRGDRTSAERHWKEVVKRAAPSLIEYAAARNELARLGS
jgi:tetratricopeptide (TPR) repeat protein